MELESAEQGCACLDRPKNLPVARNLGRLRVFDRDLADRRELAALVPGDLVELRIFDLSLVVLRVDRLSLVFAYIFEIATLLAIVYSLHVRDAVQQLAGLVYSGSAIAAVFAGDLVTLFVLWELTAIASVFGMNLIVNASTRYWQLAVVLLAMLTISFLLLRWARKQGWW